MQADSQVARGSLHANGSLSVVRTHWTSASGEEVGMASGRDSHCCKAFVSCRSEFGYRPRMSILIGSASWADKRLIACGRFYPPGTRTAEARLRYYARQFPLVEADATYYAMPTAETSRLWAERTPDGFTVNVKAFRLLTGHQTAPQSLPADIVASVRLPAGRPVYYRQLPGAVRDEMWRRFNEGVMPLAAAGRLGAVLFQFPPWVVNDRAGRVHVADCVAHTAPWRAAIEFRHQSWFAGAACTATLDFLRDLGAVHVVADEPQGFENSVPALWQATHDALAMVRMHGRNAASWQPAGIGHTGGRFNYEYPESELAELAVDIRALAERVADIHIVLNTNNEDQGQRNARKLMRVLGLAAPGP
jgi:uncharacterized protein YecE (DUF72 family)